MRLSQLLSIYPQLRLGEQPNQEISGLTNDSREVKKGSVYVAIRGSKHDGHKYLNEVCKSEPAAIVVDDLALVPATFRGAVVHVENTRSALDHLAAQFWGRPADRLFCVGVTGTNGKTSTTYLIEKVLSRFGWKTGVLGTINHHLGTHVWPSQLTTPDPLVLQKRLAEFSSLGAEAVTFEVSSHAIEQNRVDHVPFDVTVFTNLTRDHLDYHGTMDKYFAAKARLFNQILARSSKPQTYAVVNTDDPWGKRIEVFGKSRLWTYGQREADLKFTIQAQSFAGTVFELKTPRGTEQVNLPVPGLHNVYNAVAAIGVGLAAGASLETCCEALQDFEGVPGRLQRVKSDAGFNVFVDYAHTDDALRVVLRALNEVRSAAKLSGRILTVFGCGGDRDKGKRPLMAQAAVEGSDFVFVTSDNPRTEDPMSIIKDTTEGILPELMGRQVFIEADRRMAIGRALQTAQVGDVILIAGKGHEDYQIVGTERLPFSDVEVVKEWLHSRGN